jgi:hypothetical protein
MQSTKPFFMALENVLKTRLPHDAFAQVMEESLWEFEAARAEPERNGNPASVVRLGSICISFYRAMTKIGIRPESALETLNEAGERLGWSAVPETSMTTCSLASYFRAKNALPICRTVFCKTCRLHRNGCNHADSLTEDWQPGGMAG